MMMSANVKANMKQQRNKKSGGCILYFFKTYRQNLKYNVKESGLFIRFLLAFQQS